ncbi:hypothetical protein [Helicobacter pylori]|nr:hypothetical protein [Helicobacter pylori]
MEKILAFLRFLRFCLGGKEFLDFVLMSANDKSLTEIFCCAFLKASGFFQ